MKPSNVYTIVPVPSNVYQVSSLPCAKDFFQADEGNKIVTVNFVPQAVYDLTNQSWIFQLDLSPIFNANAIKSVRSIGVDLLLNMNTDGSFATYVDLPTVGDMMMLGFLGAAPGDFSSASGMREVISSAGGFLVNLTFDSSFISGNKINAMNAQFSIANFKRSEYATISSSGSP